MSLELLGWTPALAQAFEVFRDHLDVPFQPGRVIRQDRLLRVQTEDAAVLATPAGRLGAAATSQEELPVIGDWVAVTPGGPSDVRHVIAIAPRSNVLSRRRVGAADRPQPMAANVDRVLVVIGLDTSPNLRRLERSLTWVWDSGAVPAVVLNKVDACPDYAAALAEVAEVAPGVEVVAASARTGEGLADLRALLSPGQTGLLLGPSGVGKSSLLNALLGGEAMATGEVRASDRKGRHTTTHRELRRLPWGALLVDMGGLRELGLWSEGDATQSAFPELTALVCRFADCGHGGEPGCAVRAAVEAGEVSEERVRSYLKLQRELERLATRTDPRAAQARKQRERALSLAAWRYVRKKRS